MLIVGLTGTLGAGKGTIVDYLVQKYGFQYFSVRAFLVEKIQQRGSEVNRDSMVAMGNELREKYGPGYIVQELYTKAAETGRNTIIESIRTVGEINALKAKGPFHLLAIDADPSLRYERITARGNETDHIGYPEFLSNEEREMQSFDPNKQNLQGCIALANYTIVNDGSFDDLYKQVNEIMKKIGI